MTDLFTHGRSQESTEVIEKKTKDLTYADSDTGLANGTYYLNTYERVVDFSTVDTAAGFVTPFVISMPPVTECAGLFFSLFMTVRDTSNVTVEDRFGDTTEGDLGGADLTFDANLDAAILYSDGKRWYKVYTAGGV